MDKLINTHIDTTEELERQIDIIIEQEVSQISIDEVIVNPQEALSKTAGNIRRIFLDKYADKAVELGFDFGRAITKKIADDKTVKVDNSKDPQLNAPDENNQ